jgi:hypothetical protein
MPFNRVANETTAELHAADAARHRARRADQSRGVNARPVLYLVEPVRWPFRGRMYEVPPIPFRTGVRVVAFTEWVNGLRQRKEMDGFADEYRDKIGGALKIIRRCVIPDKRYRVRRLLWRLRLMPNPWRTASVEEVSELMGFFSGRLTKSLDRQAPAPAP